MSIQSQPQDPLQAVREQIEALTLLRRRLCAYVNSDKFCDCKTLTGLPLYTVAEPQRRSGERSGCCEVRAAIAMLRILEKSLTSIETKSEAPAELYTVAEKLSWCKTHRRKATHLHRGKPCCDPKLGGILAVCDCIPFTP